MRLERRGASLVARTPAKLNLFLEVLGRRADGYHELETVMVSIGLYDTLRFDPEVSGRLELSLADGQSRQGIGAALLPIDDNNLVLRAARLLREVTGCLLGAHITLTKNIPLQAGLGGGSSDAAATLVALNQFWQLGLSPAELHSLAAQLGSDVNFFLDSVPLALCHGRGEQIEPRRLSRPLHFVVIKPAVGLSTREVFQRLHLTREPRSSGLLLDGLRSGCPHAVGQGMSNALEAPAVSLSGEVAKTLDCLRGVPAWGSLMTGSGSSCFSVFAHAVQAARAARRLRAMQCGQVFVVSAAI